MICDACHHTCRLCQSLHIFLCKNTQLSDRRIFLEDNLAFSVCKNLQRGSLLDPQCAPNLFWNHNSSKVIDAADDSCSFHIGYVPPVVFPYSVLYGYYMENKENYVHKNYLS